MNTLYKIFLTIFSFMNIFQLNFYLFFLKKNKKIVFFYFLKKSSKEQINSIEKYLKKFKNYTIIYGSSNFLKRNYFIIKPSHFKMICGPQIFITDYVVDDFPAKTKNYYLHHDIYDTPLLEKKKEKTLIKRLNFYDNILLPSQKSLKVFDQLFKNKKEKPKIDIIGEYPKLTYLDKYIKKPKSNFGNKRSIIIAPSGFYGIPRLSMKNHLYKIINLLLNKKYKVIFRPHPDNISNDYILKIKNKFDNNNLFQLDVTRSYLQQYYNSSIMITDYSGTAYTYSMMTLNPVLFFSFNESYVNKLKYNELNYFKDRTKIGLVSYKSNEITKNVKRLIKYKKKYSKNILMIKKNFFFNKNLRNKFNLD